MENYINVIVEEIIGAYLVSWYDPETRSQEKTAFKSRRDAIHFVTKRFNKLLELEEKLAKPVTDICPICHEQIGVNCNGANCEATECDYTEGKYKDTCICGEKLKKEPSDV